MRMLQNSRIKYIDIAKGIAIICVILGHLGISNINKIVFTFHVPIFFFITGFFTNTNLSIKDFIKHKVKTLIIPYLFTCLVIIFLATLEYGIFIDKESAIQTFKEWVYASIYGAGDSYSYPFHIKAIGALWFLLATFWGSIFLRIILTIKNGTGTKITIVLILFIIGYWSRNLFWFPFSIQAGCCSTLFLYFGYLLNISKNEIKQFSIEIKAVGTLFALLTWLDFIKNFQSFWLVHCDIGRGIIDIFGCICGCYIITLLSWYIETHIHILSKILSFLGKYSLFMLCIHNIELNILPWWQITQKLVLYGMPEYCQIYLIIIGKLTIVIISTIICSRCNIIRKIFGMYYIERKKCCE